MSLKAFHVFFVAATVVLMAFLSGWSFLAYRETQAVEHLVWSLCSAASVVGLVMYGRFFLRKLRNVSFL
jgi:mannose/fructose/N-acetylgalactosamine-specific phosphotransferase system component IID